MLESSQGSSTFNEWLIQRENKQIISEYTAVEPIQIRDFVYGCNIIKGKFEAVRPDAVFYPERGASPIAWAVEELWYDGGRSDKEYYRPVFIPIGTKVDPTTNSWSGISRETKQEVVSSTVQDLVSKGIKISKPVLVDEVQIGGTLSFVAPILYDALHEAYGVEKMNVIAAKDSKTGQIRVKKLRQMLTQRFPELPTMVALLPLFFIDQVNMLDIIVEDEPSSKYRLVRNGTSESIIKLITQISLLRKPERIDFLSSQIVDSANMNNQEKTVFYDWLEQISNLE